MKPKIFIGSSVEGLPIAEAVQQNLDYFAHVNIWDNDIFSLSTSNLKSLLNALDSFDFAIFIFSPDDSVITREKEFVTVRDNVIYEMGLFTGKLGIECVYFLKPRNREMKIPSDLLGIVSGNYDESNPELSSAVRSFTTEVKKSIEKQIQFKFPSDGFWGSNLLSESLTNIIANKSYSMKCIAPKSILPTILIKNISDNGLVQSPQHGWFLAMGKFKDIDFEIYDRENQQQMFRFMKNEGDREITFMGSGKAIVKLTNGSDKVILEKVISWG